MQKLWNETISVFLFEEEGAASVLNDAEKLSKMKMANWPLVLVAQMLLLTLTRASPVEWGKKPNWSELKSEWE